MLPVTRAGARVLAPTEFDDLDLARPRVLDHAALHRGALDPRRAHLHVITVRDQQDVGQLDRVPLGGRQKLDTDGVARRHAILLAARLDDCVHWLCSRRKTPNEPPGQIRLGGA